LLVRPGPRRERLAGARAAAAAAAVAGAAHTVAARALCVTRARITGGGANIPGGVLWDAITSAELDFTWLSWDGISGGARDIVRAMLERDPQQRPTAAQLLQHPWLSGAQECAACWGARRPPPSADDCRACVQQQGAGTASSSSSSRGGAGGAGKQQQQQQQQPGAQEALESPGPPPHHPQQQQQQQAQQQQAQRDGQAPAHVPLYLRPLEDSLVQRLQRYGTFSRLKQVCVCVCGGGGGHDAHVAGVVRSAMPLLGACALCCVRLLLRRTTHQRPTARPGCRLARRSRCAASRP
jgi:hypothetical protein